jgi:hypothetical protein
MLRNAEVAEWLNALVCKTNVLLDYGGSNPPLSTMSINKLEQVLNNNPLVVNHSITISKKARKKQSLFFGVGIMTADKLSMAVPFDILGLFFTAEQIRKELKLNKVIVLIADTHAISNKLFSKKQINNQTKKILLIINKIIKNFNLSHFEILLGSNLKQDLRFQKIFDNLPNFPNQYLKHEVADAIWLSKFQKAKIKLGWTMENNKNIKGHDERFFDQKIQQFCPNISLVHLKAGHTFDKLRSRVSPYISIAEENRILLKKCEDINQKIFKAKKIWSDPNLGGALNHLAKINRLFEKLFEPLGKKGKISLEQKLQIILEKAIK